jgi:hypothetical protein
MRSMSRDYEWDSWRNELLTRLEADSNTSTVTLRVVGSLKIETVKYGRPKGLGSEKDCAGEGQQHIQKKDPSSRQRGRPTKTKP